MAEGYRIVRLEALVRDGEAAEAVAAIVERIPGALAMAVQEEEVDAEAARAVLEAVAGHVDGGDGEDRAASGQA